MADITFIPAAEQEMHISSIVLDGVMAGLGEFGRAIHDRLQREMEYSIIFRHPEDWIEWEAEIIWEW